MSKQRYGAVTERVMRHEDHKTATAEARAFAERVGKSKNGGADAPLQVKLRGLTMDDAAFIIDSWCSSYSRSPLTGRIDSKLFKIEQRARINRILPKSKMIIACNEQDPRSIYGWVCYTPNKQATSLPTIHYMCVKPEYQGRGIGKSLLDLVRQACGKSVIDPVFYTHGTVVANKLESKWNIVFNPYLLEIL